VSFFVALFLIVFEGLFYVVMEGKGDVECVGQVDQQFSP
jgi:hypothetical protein